MKSAFELRRELETWHRELDRCVDQAKSYRELVKKTRDELKVQEAAEAALNENLED